MVKAECEKKTRILVDYLTGEFDLSHWYLHWEVNNCDCNDHTAQVAINYEQQEAWINVESQGIEGDRELARYVRHEMIHLLASPYELVLTHIKNVMGERDREKYFETLSTYASERHVRYIERLCEKTTNTSLDALIAVLDEKPRKKIPFDQDARTTI